jgi:hypothetical protein
LFGGAGGLAFRDAGVATNNFDDGAFRTMSGFGETGNEFAGDVVMVDAN